MIAGAAPVRLERRYWHMLAPRWSHLPLSGEGAARHGGRHNRPGTPALYMSEDFTTAIAEYEADLGIRPGTLCAYDVAAGGVLDLTDPATLAALDVAPTDLAAPWKQIALVEGGVPPTWRLAERLIAAGCTGVRVPSVRGPGANLVLWRWNDGAGATVAALDPLGDLPRNPRSWEP